MFVFNDPISFLFSLPLHEGKGTIKNARDIKPCKGKEVDENIQNV